MGISKEGEPTGDFQLGMELHAKYTILPRGTRWPSGQADHRQHQLDAESDPQTYGIGIKELWEIDPKRHQPGFRCCTPPAGPWTTTPTAAPSSTT